MQLAILLYVIFEAHLANVQYMVFCPSLLHLQDILVNLLRAAHSAILTSFKCIKLTL